VSKYGWHWETVIRPSILRRAGGVFDEQRRYEGGARCERCGIPDRMPLSVWAKSEIDVAHLDGDRGNAAPENLAALCRQCHRGSVDYRVWSLQFTTYLERKHRELIAERESLIDAADEARPILQIVRAS